MYRNSAQINIARASLPSPAPDDLLSSSETEPSILAELAHKRKELDAEIACFKKAKDKEFARFEHELRSRNHPTSHRTQNGVTAAKPTVELDRVTVNGQHTPPPQQQLSRSPTGPENLAFTPPRRSERRGDFAGLFAPAYLPLLEGAPDRGEKASSSVPRVRERGAEMRRATAPVVGVVGEVGGGSLPSALRRSVGGRRKTVTFQLEEGEGRMVEPSEGGDKVEDVGSPVKELASERMLSSAVAINGVKLGSPKAKAYDGGSGVGFFELDEELGGEEEDREGGGEVDYGEDEDEVGGRFSKEREGGEEEELKSGSFHAGSLPIDIVRPGSFRGGGVG